MKIDIFSDTGQSRGSPAFWLMARRWSALEQEFGVDQRLTAVAAAPKRAGWTSSSPNCDARMRAQRSRDQLTWYRVSRVTWAKS